MNTIEMNTTLYQYAVQIQPLTGQQLEEVTNLEIKSRAWSSKDRKQFPKAERSLWGGSKLVVDTEVGGVYAVEA